MNAQTQRFYVDARIGNHIARFPKTSTSTPSGISTLAVVSGGLTGGRTKSSPSVIEQLSRIVSRKTFANAV